MSGDAYGVTVAKRRLSRRLAELRTGTGYTASHVCDVLSWGRGKVGRFEANQWKRPEMSDIRDLIRVYDVEDADRGEIISLAVRCRRVRPWWREYGDVFGNEFPGYENDATSIRVYMPLVLPELLQTPAYMAAQLTDGPRSPVWCRKAREARLRRQRILDRADGTAPRLTAVLTEASLLYRWGTREDRGAQLAHLARMSRRRDVELRIQRFADGSPAGICSMVNIFGFAGDEPPIVFVATDHAVAEVTEPEAARGYIQAFERVRAAALGPEDTTAYLEDLAGRMD
jgi:hypothetical protein